MIHVNYRMRVSLTLFGLLLLISINSFALPFSIVPTAGTSLPTKVLSGQTITALYTVTNNTASVRVANYVKYLPPNVAQVTFNP